MAIYESLQKEKVVVGDVIFIEATTGQVTRVGRSDEYATEFDLEAEKYLLYYYVLGIHYLFNY